MAITESDGMIVDSIVLFLKPTIIKFNGYITEKL
jgi:hypothetical protein